MAALVPFVSLPPPVFQWIINVAKQLIAERRNIHQQFERISNRHHNALKRGYENLSKIINNNNDDIPIVSPNSFDRACFADMNDEFWLQTNESIDGGMLRMIDVDMNIDCEGKEGNRDLGLDQEVEIEVKIEDETEVEIEDG
ncbi:19022_t:CDS:2 [Rhizophagus irregularis]|nr:19022_t:CDS:2 [Rhizophagus irregularis]